MYSYQWQERLFLKFLKKIILFFVHDKNLAECDFSHTKIMQVLSCSRPHEGKQKQAGLASFYKKDLDIPVGLIPG